MTRRRTSEQLLPILNVGMGWRVQLLPPDGYEAAYRADQPVIGFAFDGQHGLHAFDSDRVRPFRARPNGLGFVPAGCDVYSASPSGGEYLKVTECSGEGPSQFPTQRFSDVIDPVAIAAAHAIRRHFLGTGPAAEPLIEEQIMILVERVRARLPQEAASSKLASSITSSRLKRIDEFIDGHIEGKIRVGDLADMLGLSEGFFIRAFKAATGTNPHGYLIDRRIARARQLLTGSSYSISEIALMVGFASHAHMSACFRTRLGITPSRFCANR